MAAVSSCISPDVRHPDHMPAAIVLNWKLLQLRLPTSEQTGIDTQLRRFGGRATSNRGLSPLMVVMGCGLIGGCHH